MPTEKPTLDFELAVDDEQYRTRSANPVILDDTVTLLARESRLGLSLVRETDGEEAGKHVKYLVLRCMGNAAPGCELGYLRLTVSFTAPGGLQVADLQPELVKSSEPVKITTTYGGGLKLEALSVKLGPEAKAERSRESSFYFAEIRGTGKHFTYADWTFEVPAGQALHVNRDLHLLVHYPGGEATPVISEITLRAKVRRKGVLGYVPLVGKRSVALVGKGSW